MYWLIESERRIYASSNYANIGSDNGLSPDQRHAIIRTNAGILVFGCFGTYFKDIYNIHWKYTGISGLE